MRFSSWRNRLSAAWLIILLTIAATLAWSWLHRDIHIQTNIFALLPEQSQDKALQKTRQYVSGQLNNQVFLVVDAPDEQTLQQATVLLSRQLQNSPLWQPLKAQLDTAQFAETLYRHHAGLISTEDRQLLRTGEYAGLTEQRLLQIMSPGMPVTEDLLKQDPLLLFPRFVMGLSAQQGNQAVEMEQGFATLHDERGISRLFTLQLTQSPYNIDYQKDTAVWIQQLNRQMKQLGVQTHWTGTLLFASAGTSSAEKEISTIGLGSSLGVLLLVWFGFRSFRPMLTEFVAVTSGTLVAFAVTHGLFSEIHLMTLVFGASLVGVCVDFSFYFMALQSQHRNMDGFAILRPILPSLFMGLMTTLVAYVFLTFTPFPGFRQIAVFSIVGLTAAWITSVLLLPRLKALNAEPAIQTLRFIGHMRRYFLQHHRLRYGSVAVILLTALISLSFLKTNDDIRNLQSMDRQLKQQDHYVRERFGQQQGSDYFVIRAQTPSQLEKLEQQLIQQLSVLKSRGALQDFQAIGQSIPSRQQQQQNIQLLQQIPAAELVNYATAMQLNVRAVLNWQKQLSAQPVLSLSQFQAHPLSFLQLHSTERLVLLQDVRNEPALRQLQTAQIKLLQPVKNLSDLFQAYRIQAQYLLFYALIALAIGLGLIYGIRAILPLVFPVSLALLSTFAVQAWLGIELNLFSIMGSFLIMGIGVDYAIFYRHGHDHPQVVGMALFLCMMSTLLGFGLLSFSQTYAIHCFGLTVLLGVIFSFIYASLLTRADQGHRVVLQHQDLQNQHGR
ncbi:MMPL family transporter [Acinetobacter sp. WZC-1]|uniref:MMPL family transporter n=1 Tax=Acinetobacter sp. WZC-1 TaxID=3459034 RepID=UPI00403DFAF6